MSRPISIESIKRQAKYLKKTNPNVKLHLCQDFAAQSHGFNSFKHAVNSLSNQKDDKSNGSAESKTDHNRLFEIQQFKYSGENDFRNKMLPMWFTAIKSICQNKLKSYTWTNPSDIVNVLNLISAESVNHTFFPDGGGMDLTGALIDKITPKNILVNFGSSYGLLEPQILRFEFIENASLEWSYFSLEPKPKTPTGITENLRRDRENEEIVHYESLFRLRSGQFVDSEDTIQESDADQRANWREFGTNELYVLRTISSTPFLIFAKPSIFNLRINDYRTPYNKLPANELKTVIQSGADKVYSENLVY